MSGQANLVPRYLLTHRALVGSGAWKMWVKCFVEMGENMVSEDCMFTLCVQKYPGANWTFVLRNNSFITRFIMNLDLEI